MSGRRSAGLALVDQALVSGVNCLTTVVIVRALGLAGFGHFSILWMSVMFVLLLQQALIATPMLSIGPKQHGQASREYYAGLLRLEGVFLGLVTLAGLALAGPISRAGGEALTHGELAALLAAVAGRCAQDFVRQQGFARELRSQVLVLDALTSGLQLAGLVALGITGHMSAALALAAIALANAAGVAFWFAVERGVHVRGGSIARVVQRHARMSRWLVARVLLQWLSANAFAIAAGLSIGPAAVGAIKAGQTVMGLLHVWLLTLENVAPVRAARLVALEAWGELRAYWRRVNLGCGLATLAISALVAALPGTLARLFYGATSPEQELVIRGFALLYLFVFVTTVLSIRLRTLEHTRPIFLAQALGAGLGTLAARPVVESFGLAGALGGMVLQQVIVCGVLLLAVRRCETERAAQPARLATGVAAP
ncbi:MAG: hypothetical protein IPJ19_11485 [Planctomycetes bacterium]|nr:hypothetical protein [Planctomycetota bacterium]